MMVWDKQRRYRISCQIRAISFLFFVLTSFDTQQIERNTLEHGPVQQSAGSSSTFYINT